MRSSPGGDSPQESEVQASGRRQSELLNAAGPLVKQEDVAELLQKSGLPDSTSDRLHKAFRQLAVPHN